MAELGVDRYTGGAPTRARHTDRRVEACALRELS